MKIALLSIIGLLAMPSVSQPDSHTFPAWMSGSWEKTDGEKWADEFWTLPRGDIMIGASRSGEGNKLGFWEHMRIVREPDGRLAFWALTGNQPAVRFLAIETTSTEIIFVNAEHDYPQRIRYWIEGSELHAEISLADGSRTIKFAFTKVAK